MYGIDKKLDLTFLIGKMLTQICVGQFQIILNFDNEVSISIEGTFEHISGEIVTKYLGISDVSQSLFNLIQQKIEVVNVLEDGTLRLTFTDSTMIKLHDSNPDTESYQISSPLISIVV